MFAEELSTDLYRSWKAFAENAGELPGSQKRLSEELQARGFKKGRQARTGRITFLGLRLNRPDYTEDERYGS